MPGLILPPEKRKKGLSVAQEAKNKDGMAEFRQGVEAGYALAVQDVWSAIETGEISRRNRQAFSLLELRFLDCVERCLEDSGDGSTC